MTDSPHRAVVAAAAPLFASADAAREIGSFESTAYRAYREWVRAYLPRQDVLSGRLQTVALSGESVRLLGDVGPALVTVELLDQPNGDTGYVGVMSAAHVGVDARRKKTHVVTKQVVAGKTADPAELPAGTTVEALDDRPDHGAVDVLLSSGATARCPRTALRRLGSGVAPAELLRIAEQFLTVPYFWGGIEASGIDCSGLVHLTARIGGYLVPRDAHYQWAATRCCVDWDSLEVGDLLFFGERATLDGISHVGMYGGDGRMLHAPESGRQVTLETIGARHRARAVGFGRCATF